MRYELIELVNLAAWQHGAWDVEVSAKQTFGNAMLESGLVHTRNLLEFLLNVDNNGTYIVANDFAESWTPSDKESLGRDYGRISANLTHLSKKRATMVHKETWNLHDLAQRIVNEFDNLANSLPSTDPQATQFKAMVKKGRSVLAGMPVTQGPGPGSTDATITGTTGGPPGT